MRIEDLGEFELIERIRRQIVPSHRGTVVGIGDDTAALLPSPGQLLLATCDSQIEGRHFIRSQITAEQLGRRLAAVNLSDLAAMGGNPRWALVALVLPEGIGVDFIDELYSGLNGELARFGAQIVGGNISGGEALVLDLTLLGEVAPDRVLRRGGAQSGDALLVSGALGSAAAGRRAIEAGLDAPEATPAIVAYQTPEPRVREGQAIARSGLATAMIDISDGLAADLGHVCEASGVGAVVEQARLPVSPATRWVCDKLHLDSLPLALGGGEDYELLCTVPMRSADKLIALVAEETGTVLSQIGWISDQSSGRVLQRDDRGQEPLKPLGWRHFGPKTV